MLLLERVLKDLDRLDLRRWLAHQRVVVGASGGADSLCLLHVLKRLSSPLDMAVYVATLDHGLRGEASAADADFVAQTAAAWELPVRRAYRDVSALAREHGLGIEEAARQARYTFLAQVAQEVGAQVIAVGHNADDQAETVLMHLIRGSGLAGLRGMLPVTPLGDYHLLPDAPPVKGMVLVRPLLDIPRAAIDAYCAAHNLHPRQDATNEELTYFRNRLRHEVLPMLATLNPNVREALARTGHVLAADYTQLQALVQTEFQAALRQHTEALIRLDLNRFRRPDLSLSLRRGLLRHAVQQIAPHLRDVSFVTIERALEIALYGDTGSQATLPGAVTLQVEYDTLLLHRSGVPLHRHGWPRLPSGAELPVYYPGQTPLPDSAWTLHTRWLEEGESPRDFYGDPYSATLALPEAATLMLRTRLPGDRFRPLGMGGHTQRLSDTLINAKVPAAQRDSLPLLTVNGEIAWIALGPQSRIAAPFAVDARAARVLLAYWSRQPAG